MSTLRRLRARNLAAQTSVEFSIAFMAFALLVFGGIDVGRAIFDLHGLNRAGEAIAHSLDDQYSTVSGFQLSTDTATPLLIQAHQSSHVAFSVATPTGVSGPDYVEFSNGSVYMCASSNSGDPQAYPQMLRVTVIDSFHPALGLILGGKSLTLSQSVEVLTRYGEAQGITTDYCPSH